MSVEREESESQSAIAERIRRLKRSVLAAAQGRERLPQPLFWSLFHSQIAEIREAKEEKRLERRLLFGEPIA